MKNEEAHRIRDLLRSSPQEIRVLCPRGHFIAHIGLYVFQSESGPSATDPIRMHPRGPDKQYVGDLSQGHHGFRMDLNHPTQSYNVRLECTNRKCRYNGSFEFHTLGVDLAVRALNGHAEYRLIS